MWRERDLPIAYFITFSTRGTSLTDNSRSSSSRTGSTYRSEYAPNTLAKPEKNRGQTDEEVTILDRAHRKCIESAIRKTCEKRDWELYAKSVGTSHVRLVANVGIDKPAVALNAFKANAEMALRESGLYVSDGALWSSKGSKRWLWTQAEVKEAVDYVLSTVSDVAN